MPSEHPRLLVIGAGGFLGGHMARMAQREFQVIRATRTGQAAEIKIDVTEPETVRSGFRTSHPDVVMLFAAIADIDRCEQFPEQARAVNFKGAEHVAEACIAANARLLFVSTGAVFDGRKHGYTEDDPASPVSIYGHTKALAEQSILKSMPTAIVVRIALAIGFAAIAGTNALLDSLRNRWASGETVSLPTFEQRNPIDPVTASRLMMELVRKKASGVFHLGSLDPITRYELGIMLATYMGYSGKVKPQAEPTPGRAPRGPDHYLLTDKLRAISSIAIPTCDQVIARCFDVSAQSKV